jgi:predicted permease
VARATFNGLVRGMPADMWIPLTLRSRFRARDPLANRGARHLFLLGVLAPGATPQAVAAQLATVAADLQRAYPEQWTDSSQKRRRVTVIPERQARVLPAARDAVLGVSALLAVIAALILFLACANVASLMLARTAERRREVAVRLTLGATRARLVRLFLAESLLLAVLGGSLGLLLALWSTDLISAFHAPAGLPLQLSITLDGRVLAFAFASIVLTALLIGLVPALQASRPSLVGGLRDGGAGPGGTRRTRTQRVFVVAQVAVSVVLLVSGGLFLRSLGNAMAIDSGFGAGDAAMVSYDLSSGGYTEAQGRAFHERVLERAAAIPGVESVALGDALPLSLEWQRRGVWVPGDANAGDREHAVGFAGPGFFETLGVTIVRGRGFTRYDVDGAAPVVVVNETFARRFWPGQDALGKQLSASGEEGPFLEVVGIARDGKYFTLGEDPRPHFYLPLQQNYRSAPTLIARTSVDPHLLLPALRAAIHDLDRGLAITSAQTLSDHVGVSLLPTRTAGAIVGSFGVVGVGLACIGLYGLLAHTVRERTQEIGVRLALGAAPRTVLALVLWDGLRLVAVGLALGIPLAALLGGSLRGFLYGLSPADPVTFVAVVALLVAVATLAIWHPARRASRVDPVHALRHS